MAKRWKVVGSEVVKFPGNVLVECGQYVPEGVPEDQMKLLESEGVIAADEEPKPAKEEKKEEKPAGGGKP